MGGLFVEDSKRPQLPEHPYDGLEKEWAQRFSDHLNGTINLYQELGMRSRHVDTHRDPGGSVNITLHSHTFYEILFCRGGSIQYLLGADRFHIGRGDIIVIPPGVSHRPLPAPNTDQSYDRYVIWLSKDFTEMARHIFNASDQLIAPDPALLRTANTQWEFLERMFAAGVREAEGQKPGWETAVIGNTLQLLVHLRRAMSETGARPPAETPELLDRILAYIERHLAEKITLSGAAKYFFVSESTISHLFCQRLGVSFYRCVIQRRLIEAKVRILAGDSLEAAARSVGFSDYSAFYRMFKQEYGISPTQYKAL